MEFSNVALLPFFFFFSSWLDASALSAGMITCQVDVTVIIILPGFRSRKQDYGTARARWEVLALNSAGIQQRLRMVLVKLQTVTEGRRGPCRNVTATKGVPDLLSWLSTSCVCPLCVRSSPRRLGEELTWSWGCVLVSVDTLGPLGLGWDRISFICLHNDSQITI